MSKTAKARNTVSRVQDSPVLHAVARAGYVVNGLLHILIGLIALSIAFGGGGEADPGGALSQIAVSPGGLAILWAIAIGLWGLAVFQLLEAALIRGSDRKSWGARAKEAGKAVAYVAVGVTAFTYTLGSSSDSGEQTQSLSARLLASPGGVVVLVVVAALVVAIGVYFLAKGARKRFVEDLTVPPGLAGRITLAIGTIGYVAKGVAVVVVGILFGVAAVTADPSEATGLDGALKALATLPLGIVVLCAIALGLVAYGVYCFVRAAYARL